jgi:acetoin:2,6-dichlorophenolindophenol oxidoreductase subunit alpha
LELTKTDMLDIYETLLTIRISEQTMYDLYRRGELPGHILPCLGQEAIPAAFSKLLRDTDFVVTGHRGGGHYIARKGDFKRLWAELYGKREGIMKGKGGQIHLVDMNKNTIAGNAIVGANWVLGTGAGLAAHLDGKGAIAACFGGEGSTNRGTFHEGINFAAVKKLPVVFVCEFNNYQLWNRASEVLTVENIAVRSASYNIPGITVDGNDVLAIYEAAKNLVARARQGEGPSILECKTFKWTDSGTNLRLEKEEVEYWQTYKDPVKLYRSKLKELAVLDSTMDEEIIQSVTQQVKEAVAYGQQCTDPTAEEAVHDVYCMQPDKGGELI